MHCDEHGRYPVFIVLCVWASSARVLNLQTSRRKSSRALSTRQAKSFST